MAGGYLPPPPPSVAVLPELYLDILLLLLLLQLLLKEGGCTVELSLEATERSSALTSPSYNTEITKIFQELIQAAARYSAIMHN